MPKIAKKSLIIGTRPHEFEIYYSSREGFYCKGLSESIINAVVSVDGPDSYGSWFQTEDELMIATKKLLYRYYEIITTEKKIILVKLKFGRSLRMNQTGPGSWSGSNPRVGDIPHKWDVDDKGGLDYSFGFEYSVGVIVEGNQKKFFEIFVDDNGNEKRESNGKSMNGYIQDIQIEYTPERLQFFKSMESGMEQMAKKIVSFFADEKKMLQLIDSKQKLLS